MRERGREKEREKESEREREREVGGNSAVASNSVYPLRNEEDGVDTNYG